MPGLARGWRPNYYPDLAHWINADMVPGTDGDPVSTVVNLAPTGTGNNLSQSGAARPTIKRNIINGHSTVHCDGASQWMLGTFAAGSTGLTHYSVHKTAGATSNYGCVMGSGGSGAFDAPTTGVRWVFACGDAVDTFGAGWGSTDGSIGLGNVSGIAINTVFYARYRTNKVAWSIEGPNSGTPADTSFPTATFQYHLGCEGTIAAAPQVPFNGDIAERLVYSRALSTAEDASVKQYLKNRYNFS